MNRWIGASATAAAVLGAGALQRALKRRQDASWLAEVTIPVPREPRVAVEAALERALDVPAPLDEVLAYEERDREGVRELSLRFTGRGVARATGSLTGLAPDAALRRIAAETHRLLVEGAAG